MKQIIFLVVVLLILFLAIMYLRQRHFMYFPAQEAPALKDYGASDMQVVNFETTDGLRLNSWYKSAIKKKPTILYLHGNSGHVGFRMPLVRQFLDEGFGVLLLEYRGYGGNPGAPTEQGLYDDSRAAVQFLQQQGIEPHNLALYGESLGTGVATKLATEFPVCAVVLQSPFTSFVDLTRYHYPWALINPWDRFDSLSRVEKIAAPLLILHGLQDKIVPFPQGQRLFHQAKEPKKFLAFEGGHNDLWERQHFVMEVIQFITHHCK